MTPPQLVDQMVSLFTNKQKYSQWSRKSGRYGFKSLLTMQPPNYVTLSKSLILLDLSFFICKMKIMTISYYCEYYEYSKKWGI